MEQGQGSLAGAWVNGAAQLIHRGGQVDIPAIGVLTGQVKHHPAQATNHRLCSFNFVVHLKLRSAVCRHCAYPIQTSLDECYVLVNERLCGLVQRASLRVMEHQGGLQPDQFRQGTVDLQYSKNQGNKKDKQTLS